jgi:hypothetical protein
MKKKKKSSKKKQKPSSKKPQVTFGDSDVVEVHDIKSTTDPTKKKKYADPHGWWTKFQARRIVHDAKQRRKAAAAAAGEGEDDQKKKSKKKKNKKKKTTTTSSDRKVSSKKKMLTERRREATEHKAALAAEDAAAKAQEKRVEELIDRQYEASLADFNASEQTETDETGFIGGMEQDVVNIYKDAAMMPDTVFLKDLFTDIMKPLGYSPAQIMDIVDDIVGEVHDEVMKHGAGHVGFADAIDRHWDPDDVLAREDPGNVNNAPVTTVGFG